MNHKKIPALLLVLGLLIGLLTGCGGRLDANTFTKDALDACYPGIYSDFYLKKAGLKVSAAKQEREQLLEEEARAFAQAFDIDWELCTEKTHNRMVQFMGRLLTKAQYEAVASARAGNSYLVTVRVAPLDTMSRLQEEKWEEVQQGWLADYANLAELEPDKLEEEWADRILDAAESCLEQPGNLAEEDITVQVEKSGGNYAINELDVQRISALILKY